jgi:hypothetical protein
MEEEFFIMRAAVVPRIGGKWEVKEVQSTYSFVKYHNEKHNKRL